MRAGHRLRRRGDGCAGLSRDYRGRLKVAEFDVALAPKTAARLRVTGTPTVVYFSKGHEVERVVGYRAGHYHRELIDQELLPPAERRITGAPPPTLQG